MDTHVSAAQLELEEAKKPKPPGILYDLNEPPPLLEWLAFSIQHLLVAFAATIGPPLAFAAIVGLNPGQLTLFVSGVLVAVGVVTLIQTIGIGPVGARLPLVNSAAFKFIGPLSIAYKTAGWGAVYGATIIGGFAMVIVGLFIGRLQKLFTPFIIGAVLIIVGTALMPIAVTSLLAVGKAYAGTPAALAVAAVPLAVMIYLSITENRVLRPLRPCSVLAGIAVGYAVSAALGLIDWNPVSAASWFGLSWPYSLGLPIWPGWVVQIAIIVIFVTAVLETAGDSNAVAAILGRTISPQQLRGAVIADGLSGPIGSLFGGLPMTTFGQNVGLVRLSGVGSRYVVAGTGVLFILLGACPKFAALIAIMPAPVLGAGLVMAFGIIAIEGVRRAGPYLASPRNAAVLILGLAPAVSLRVLPPAFLASIPSAIAPLITDALTTGLLVILVMHLILPGRTDATAETASVVKA